MARNLPAGITPDEGRGGRHTMTATIDVSRLG